MKKTEIKGSGKLHGEHEHLVVDEYASGEGEVFAEIIDVNGFMMFHGKVKSGEIRVNDGSLKADSINAETVSVNGFIEADKVDVGDFNVFGKLEVADLNVDRNFQMTLKSISEVKHDGYIKNLKANVVDIRVRSGLIKSLLRRIRPQHLVKIDNLEAKRVYASHLIADVVRCEKFVARDKVYIEKLYCKHFEVERNRNVVVTEVIKIDEL